MSFSNCHPKPNGSFSPFRRRRRASSVFTTVVHVTLVLMLIGQMVISGEAEATLGGGSRTCMMRIQKVEKVVGKCVRLEGGVPACESNQYLDPTNDDCKRR